MIQTLIKMMNEDINARLKADSDMQPIVTTSASIEANPSLAAVYVAIWNEEGEEPYQLKSDECKPKEYCSDSDWWFDIKAKMFRRYWSYHDEINGNQYVHDEVKGVRLNGG